MLLVQGRQQLVDRQETGQERPCGDKAERADQARRCHSTSARDHEQSAELSRCGSAHDAAKPGSVLLRRLQRVDAGAESLARGDREQRLFRRRVARHSEPSATDTRARARGVRIEVQRQTATRLGLQSARDRRGPSSGSDQFHLER